MDVRTNSMLVSLDRIREAPLHALSGAQPVKAVRRRIVDNNPVTPKIDVAAFNSSI